MTVTAIVLAAGQGTRMKSDIPKVLHRANGKALVQWVLDTLRASDVEDTVVVLGHGSEQVEDAIRGQATFAYQREQKGTGHAVMQAVDAIGANADCVLVVCGDTPLLTEGTIRKLIAQHREEKNAVTVLTAIAPNPFGYGRMIRDEKGIVKIVEQKDATPEEQAVAEINAGTYCFDREFLIANLPKLTTNNAQGEYYLTDLIGIARSAGLGVGGYPMEDFSESLGVNNRVQLAQAAEILRARKCNELMTAGVTIIAPAQTYVESTVSVGRDTILYPGVLLEGNTTIGEGNIIGANCRIANSTIGDDNEIQQTVMNEATVGNGCNIGPFAYLRPGATLADRVKIGDFVEVKKSTIGEGSKLPHLSYVGDAIVGSGVNIGCGSITCNYDGVNKYQTIIGDGAFIGSNTNLIAPVQVEANAFIGAGSTITKDVPADSLALTRAPLVVKESWNKKNK